MSTHTILSEPSPQTHPRKGREGKGRGTGGDVSLHPSTVPTSPAPRMDGRSAAIADLKFDPDPIECSVCPPTGCDLTCVWPSDDPQLWEGDQA